MRVLSPTAILGYGFPMESLKRGLGWEPDVIGVDAGSTDPGPYYLGEGIPFVEDSNVERDLYYLLRASLEHGIPLVISSAGGSGARPHVERFLRILGRVAEKMPRRPRVAVIWSDVDSDWLLSKIKSGAQVEPLEPGLGPLTEEAIRGSSRMVAQLGVEPFIEALKTNADVVVGGRAVDVAPFAALPIARGADRGLALHMAKILECGAIAAEPGSGSDGMLGILRGTEFEVRPLNPARKATIVSVAEHSLYERTDPYREYLPGGYVDLSAVEYEEAGDSVIVRGARWVPLDRYMVKIEGVRLAGYRVVTIAGARDPDFISRLDDILGEAEERARRTYPDGGYEVYTRVYGRDAILGPSEPEGKPCHEVCILIEVVADTPSKAKGVASLLRASLLHAGWPGRKTTAGNVAFPLSPSDLYAGRAYRWSVWHLVELSDPLEIGAPVSWEWGEEP
ncbi:MAG: DUF1446 domain-containing protein [Desulfurococcales archaeon]|nr:DUF1446 domain-containing protein [Desulfurococcales archaeon]